MTGPPPISGLTDHIGFWMRMVSNHVSQTFASRISQKGVTVAEWTLMRALYDAPPTPPSGLATQLGLTRGAITKLADRLIAKSLLQRTASMEDGRSHTLELTPTGRALVPELALIADRNDRDFFDHLGADERKEMRRLLQHLVEQNHITGFPTE